MIETQRLILKPLTYNQLVKYIQCDNSLERELSLSDTNRTISKELKEVIEQVILPNVKKSEENYLFSTLWIAISKEEQEIVGDISIYGVPNEEGAIEIGYGTHEKFQNKGFMTEIVKGIVDWSKTQISVKVIIASTDKTNTASSKVLSKNGFVKTEGTEDMLQWKLASL